MIRLNLSEKILEPNKAFCKFQESFFSKAINKIKLSGKRILAGLLFYEKQAQIEKPKSIEGAS